MLPRILLLVVLALPSAAKAEGYLYSEFAPRRTLYTVAWEYGFPTLALRSAFVNGSSPAGVEAGLQFGVAPLLSWGIDFTWNKFQSTYPQGAQATFWAVSGRATLDWYLSRSSIQPFLGIGVGGLYREAVYGPGPTQTGFGFCVDPQVGVMFTVDDGVAIKIAARWEFTTASFDVNGSPTWPVKNPSWVGVQAGLALY